MDSQTEITESTPNLTRPYHGTIWIALLFWTMGLGAGWAGLTQYSMTPGETNVAPEVCPIGAWPSESFQLMVFLHPRCPCSTATARELARILVHCEGRLQSRVFFFRPEQHSDEWIHGPLWDEMTAIPGVTTWTDPAGRLAKQFGSSTSGDVLLYDPSGRLRFRGGITPARGHEGDNRGKSAVLAHVLQNSIDVIDNPVFGCEIRREAVTR